MFEPKTYKVVINHKSKIVSYKTNVIFFCKGKSIKLTDQIKYTKIYFFILILFRIFVK